ncbi:MAG: hypothetical protein D6806_05350, partial [Deltaproteobacteria bacterium]
MRKLGKNSGALVAAPAIALAVWVFVGAGAGRAVAMTYLLPLASGSSRVLTALWRVALVEKDLFSHSIQHRGTPAAAAGTNLVVVGDSSGNVTCFRASDG